MSDTLAMGSLLALNQANINVPQDIALVGFDNLPFSQYTIPPLTTIEQPIHEKGREAAKLLIEQIENKNSEPVHKNLEPELVIRESCGAPSAPTNFEKKVSGPSTFNSSVLNELL